MTACTAGVNFWRKVHGICTEHSIGVQFARAPRAARQRQRGRKMRADGVHGGATHTRQDEVAPKIGAEGKAGSRRGHGKRGGRGGENCRRARLAAYNYNTFDGHTVGARGKLILG